ncbi:MAG: glycoside hydrolase family 38 [Opitutaceae bacterium]|jgi:alpha-mannosidase
MNSGLIKPKSESKQIIHLLPNAHLDPVWLWDWREGLNEGILTVRTVLDLMDEYSELTFMRGESAIYEHIQKTEPKTFRRILKQIECGRWDVVGGTLIQPDTNLPSTEVLCREFELGLKYFRDNLGVRPRIAWQADSFGHSAGMPNIFAAFGIEGFSFTRPQRGEFPMESPVFRWEGDHANQVLCYRQHWNWYGSERWTLPEMLDQTLAGSKKTGLTHAAVQFGLGNHGGGPTRRHLRDIEAWKRLHPDVEVRFSTLHRFFDALKAEIATKGKMVPTLKGEFGFCLRGCYSSVQKFKALYRKGEALVSEAEITRSVIDASMRSPSQDLTEAWHALAFNAFHDILPGTSIERAYEDQSAWLGLAFHRAQEARFNALNRLAACVDTSVPPPRRDDLPKDVPFLVWNPSPRPFSGLVEIEAGLDYRPLWEFRGKADQLPLVVFGANGKPQPFQAIETENSYMPDLPWRKRVLVPVEVPSLGWTTLRLGWRDKAQDRPSSGNCSARNGVNPQISNGRWAVEKKDGGLRIRKDGRNFFTAGRQIELQTLNDPWGCWGGMNEEPASINLEEVTEKWRMTECAVLESGPLRSKLWTRWQGGRSWLDLTFQVADNNPGLKAEGRLLWNERSARLKLVMPCKGRLDYDVPGGRISRDDKGQVPGGRWTVRSRRGGSLGFCSDVLGDFDATPEELRVTLARATRYANDVPTDTQEKKWQPATDCGGLKFQFCFFDDALLPDDAVDALLHPPLATIAPGLKGPWSKSGSFGRLSPDSVRLLSLEHIGEKQLRIRVQNRGESSSAGVFVLGDTRLELGTLGSQQIATFVVEQKKSGRWKPI